ncbi:hypothetical protein ABT112_29225 [Streptomyces sp. NPDC002055]|uniref:hypothetical protein n=1 Tax=Streptomyces sp. NPDC002055 TaxID=3154534 RepID=UPI0033325303
MRRTTRGLLPHGRRGTVLVSSAAVLCLAVPVAGCGSGGDDGYVAAGAAGPGQTAPGKAVPPDGGVTLIPLDGSTDGTGRAPGERDTGAAERRGGADGGRSGRPEGSAPGRGGAEGGDGRGSGGSGGSDGDSRSGAQGGGSDGSGGSSGGGSDGGSDGGRGGSGGGGSRGADGSGGADGGGSGGAGGRGSSGGSGGSGGSSGSGGSGGSGGTGGSGGGADPTPSTPAPQRPAALSVGAPERTATDRRWCEKVSLVLRNTGDRPVRSGRVGFSTHVIGGLGVDWATLGSEQALPVPIAGGARLKRTWTVCVDAWRVPLGMHIETRDVDVDWD